MGTVYSVRQGDYLARIANEQGFSDWKTIWNHSENKTLRDTRKDPNVLFPGDKLYIPDKDEKFESSSTDNAHRFVKKCSKLKLVIFLEDLYVNPLSDAEFQLVIDGETVDKTADNKGKLEHEIGPTVEFAKIIIRHGGSALNEEIIDIKIGHLDPAEGVSGQCGRLNNLGYFCGPIDAAEPEENKRLLVSAIEEFQCDHGLSVDGICGPITQAKLREIHGS